MTRAERQRRRRKRRRIRSGVLVVLVFVLAFIVIARPNANPPEEKVAAVEIMKDSPEPIVETFEETLPPVVEDEPEPESRYADLKISEEDIYTLACLVYHEARGEPFEGQVAVIEVVLNRMLSPYFPDTVEEVVFHKYGDVWQFSPAPYLWTAEPDTTQYAAVHTAIYNPESILPVETVYFSRSAYNEYVVAVIENHVFCAIEEEFR